MSAIPAIPRLPIPHGDGPTGRNTLANPTLQDQPANCGPYLVDPRLGNKLPYTRSGGRFIGADLGKTDAR